MDRCGWESGRFAESGGSFSSKGAEFRVGNLVCDLFDDRGFACASATGDNSELGAVDGVADRSELGGVEVHNLILKRNVIIDNKWIDNNRETSVMFVLIVDLSSEFYRNAIPP